MNSSNQEIDCQRFEPFPVCSGNGICDKTIGKCICNDGWSSLGDFALVDGVDCNYSVVAIKIIYALMAFLSSIIIYFCVKGIRQQIKQYRAKPGSFRGYFTDSVRVFPLWALLMVIVGFINGVYRFTYPFHPFGSDIGSTILGCLLTLFWMFSTANFTVVVLRFLHKYAKSLPLAASSLMRKSTGIILKSSPVLKVLAVIISFIPFSCLKYPQHVFQIAAVYYISLCTWTLVVALLLVVRGVSTMIKLLEEHVKNMGTSGPANDQTFKKLLVKLIFARKVFMVILPGATVGFFVFGLHPSFSRLSGYFLPYIILTGFIVMITAVILIDNRESKEKDTAPVYPYDGPQMEEVGRVASRTATSSIGLRSSVIKHTLSNPA